MTLNETKKRKMYCPHNSVLFKACLAIFPNENDLSNEFHSASFMTHLLLTWASSKGVYNNSLNFRKQERKLENFLLQQHIYPETLRSYQESFRNSLVLEQTVRNYERSNKNNKRQKKKEEMIPLPRTIHDTHTTMLPNKEPEKIIDKEALQLMGDTVNRETNSTTNNIQMESIIQNDNIDDNRTDIQDTFKLRHMTKTKKNKSNKKENPLSISTRSSNPSCPLGCRPSCNRNKCKICFPLRLHHPSDICMEDDHRQTKQNKTDNRRKKKDVTDNKPMSNNYNEDTITNNNGSFDQDRSTILLRIEKLEKLVPVLDIEKSSRDVTLPQIIEMISMLVPEPDDQQNFRHDLLRTVLEIQMNDENPNVGKETIYTKYISIDTCQNLFHKYTGDQISIKQLPPGFLEGPSNNPTDDAIFLVQCTTDGNFHPDPIRQKPSIESYLDSPSYLDAQPRIGKRPPIAVSADIVTRKQLYVNNLILVNPAASCYHDPNGIRSSKWPSGSGYYPINWTIDHTKIDDIMKSTEYLSLRNNEELQRIYWSNKSYLDVFAGENSVVQSVSRVWAIHYKPIDNNKNNCNSMAVTNVRGVQMDDSKGTFIVPDFFEPFTNQDVTSEDTNVNDYFNEEEYLDVNFRIDLAKSDAQKPTCRGYVPRRLHKNLGRTQTEGSSNHKPLIWDSTIQGPLDLSIWVMEQNVVRKDGFVTTCPQRPLTVTSISVRNVKNDEDEALLEQCNNIGEHHIGKQSNRQGDMGTMRGVGLHKAQAATQLSDFVTQKEFPHDQCSHLCQLSAAYLSKAHPRQLIAMRSAERSFGVLPGKKSMGGYRGVTASLDQSVDLANPSHFDPKDGSIAASIWTERIKKRAINWYFVLPNVQVQYNGVTYFGVII